MSKFTPVDEFWADIRLLPMNEAQALIRTRDREIIEACKQAVINAYDGSGRLRNHKAQIAALDSVLRDLG